MAKEDFGELQTAHHKLLLRVIAFLRQQRSDHLKKYAKAVRNTKYESVGMIIRQRRFFVSEAVQRTTY